MVNTAKGRLTRFRQGKHTRYFIYIPMFMTEDSMFPCKLEPGEKVKVSIRVLDGKIVVEEGERHD